MEDACAALESSPPQPPFSRAQFRLEGLQQQGHVGAGGAAPTSFDMAVEASGDAVSDVIKTYGVQLTLFQGPDMARDT